MKKASHRWFFALLQNWVPKRKINVKKTLTSSQDHNIEFTSTVKQELVSVLKSIKCNRLHDSSNLQLSRNTTTITAPNWVHPDIFRETSPLHTSNNITRELWGQDNMLNNSQTARRSSSHGTTERIKVLNAGRDTHNREDEVCKYIHQGNPKGPVVSTSLQLTIPGWHAKCLRLSGILFHFMRAWRTNKKSKIQWSINGNVVFLLLIH